MKDFELNLTGKLLVAMPNMRDPRFDKSVIFICSHDENGTIGVVINQVFEPLSFKDLLSGLEIKLREDITADWPVMLGGPVDAARGTLIHTTEFHHETTFTVGGKFGVSSSLEALQAIAEAKGPQDFIFMLGYAGWSEGQLQQEIQDNAWLILDADYEIVFNTAPAEKWQRALSRHGINPMMLSSEVGHA